MKIIATILFGLIAYHCEAQDAGCPDRIMAKNGGWKKGLVTNRASQSDYAVQKRFVDAVSSMLASYSPQGLQAQWDASHSSAVYNQRVAAYRYIIRAMLYYCNGSELKLNHETNTRLSISFNNDFGRILFDTVADDNGPGFNVLREGFPEEVQPGVWLFKNIRTALGLGNEGLTNYWLITYPGQLPWLYVTRGEFLLKRKKLLKSQLASEEPRYKEQLQKWEMQKKYKEQETKNDPAKLERFINLDYKPGIEREKANFEKLVKAFQAAIAKVDEQLAEVSALNKPAIVIHSSRNHLEYDFTDMAGPFAQILVKPNPGYFKKMAPSVPQLIELGIQYFQKDPVSAKFAGDIEKYVQLDYLRSFIGKSTPPPFNGNK